MTASTWNVDSLHSSAEFEVKHMHISTYRGRFTGVSGKVVLDDAEPSRSSIEARVDARTIAVPPGRFQEVLLGDDFFQTGQHPELIFKSIEVTRIDETHWRADGLLSIRGIERPVTLEIESIGEANQPFNRVRMRAFRATSTIDRTAWGITWNAQLDTGAAYLGEKVTLSLGIELLADA